MMRHAQMVALVTIVACWTGLAAAQSSVGLAPANTPAASTMSVQMLHKAQPDECFGGIGSPNNIFPGKASECAAGTTPKVNQGYVWGLTRAGKMLWYGTSANQQCTVISSVFAEAGIPAPPYQTACYVCEFAKSHYLVDNPQVPSALGDWRPPHIYSYNLAKNAMVDRTPNDPLINKTMGIRSAGSDNGVAILAGPMLAPFNVVAPGINLFAFNSKTGAYLGSTTLPQYSDIRIWTLYEGALYTGVQNSNGTGSVLRWRGNLKNPFAFEVVGNLDNEAAYIQGHRGRIYASTWRDINSQTSPLAAVWMSPQVGMGGLNNSMAGLWTKIWNVGEYEPDPITAAVTQGGALGEQGGYLYWGTLQVPLTAALGHLMVQVPTGTTVQAAANSLSPGMIAMDIVNSGRAIPIFRCCAPPNAASANMSGTKVELLYGDSLMNAYDPASGTWNLVPNNMNVEPRFGAAGFGNPFNTYTWAMANHRGKLFVGTFDWSFLMTDLLTANLTGLNLDNGKITDIVEQVVQSFLPSNFTYGADLWEFTGPKSPAFAQSQYGVGDYMNYGIRTMVSAPNALIVGTANPMNLATNPDDPPLGGFELLSMTP